MSVLNRPGAMAFTLMPRGAHSMARERVKPIKPAFDAQYDQMPYEEISEDEYERLAAAFPKIDFSKLFRHEEEDYTTAAQELACFAGSCDLDFVDFRNKKDN